jgi:hypothetical protein
LQQEIPDCLKDFVQVNFNSGYNLPPSTSFTPQAAATVDTGHSFSTTPKAANVGTADPYSPRNDFFIIK